jgi:hypothetical protein
MSLRSAEVPATDMQTASDVGDLPEVRGRGGSTVGP